MGQMMKKGALQALFGLTLRQPEQAARVVLGFGLARVEWLLALTLMTVLNAIIFSVFYQMTKSGLAPNAIFPQAYQSPALYALLTGGLSLLTVLALLWTGRALGGRGSLEDILAVITWLQVIRFALQSVVLVLLFVMPMLAGMLAILGNLWGLWVLISFINAAHDFNNMGRASAVLVIAVVGGLFGLTIIIALIGGAVSFGGVL